MRESANYKFNLPDKADQFNLDHWNQNTEKLDEKLKSIDDLTNNDLKTSLLNFIYPVGSLYWSSKPTNPAELFGGTWTQIKDKFVLACGDTYTNGATGGNANTTLVVENLPSHNHSFTPAGTVTVGEHTHGMNNHTHSFSATTTSNGNHNHNVYIDNKQSGNSGSSTQRPISDVEKQSSISTSTSMNGGHTHTVSGTTGGNLGNTASATPTGSFTGTAGTTGYKGDGTAFSNMPPYVVKYCWERTA